MTPPKPGSMEKNESRQLIRCAFDLARSLGIRKLLVQADEIQDKRFIESLVTEERVIWLTRADGDPSAAGTQDKSALALPDVALTRMSQLKFGLLLAILNQDVDLDESILCLSGLAGSGCLDTLLIANPRRDFPWFRKRDVQIAKNSIATREFARIVDIALRLAEEGREGRAIGTIFVLGKTDELEPYLEQLVLNPCSGHPQKSRNIHDDGFFESIREFAALDGAFVVNHRGVVESAGTYLDARVPKRRIRPGLGARHTAAAAITAATEAIAVVVSQSSGTVTVFHEGQETLELERPHG